MNVCHIREYANDINDRQLRRYCTDKLCKSIEWLAGIQQCWFNNTSATPCERIVSDWQDSYDVTMMKCVWWQSMGSIWCSWLELQYDSIVAGQRDMSTEVIIDTNMTLRVYFYDTQEKLEVVASMERYLQHHLYGRALLWQCHSWWPPVMMNT